MSINRVLHLPSLLAKKSFFLFGPRSTGKSTLIREQLGKTALVIDLLNSEFFLRLSAHPSDLEFIIEQQLNKKDFVVIDEIQKIPLLLDEVQRLIEEKKLRFLLTGSSARKLKRGQANLLAGRAWTTNLYPLTYFELKNFNLDRYLRYGGLPHVYLSENPDEELNAYAKTYLYEEIRAEGLVRKLPQFSRFLEVSALSSGQLLNFSKISSDTSVPESTVREYYTILEDTLMGFQLIPWVKSKKRKAISTAKFYFFDTGVTHLLSQTKTLERNSDLYGRSFEQWIAMEIRAYLTYSRIHENLGFWRSKHGHEVDFVIGDQIAIETKAARRVTERDLKGLKMLSDEKIFKSYYLISQDPVETKSGKFHCISWRKFLELLWNDKIFK